jgi:hypothetical protein
MKTIIDIVINKDGLYPGDLKKYFRVIWNAPNITLTYHNLQHMLAVTQSVYEACDFYDITGRQLRNMLIAAMFHDYDHTGSVGDDEANIRRAVEGLKKHILIEDNEYLLDIVSLILATQFPHKEYDEDFIIPLSWHIIRDADITYTMMRDWITPVLGLSQELNLTANSMLLGQVPFLQNNLKLSSEWGIRKYESLIKERIKEVNLIVEILMS